MIVTAHPRVGTFLKQIAAPLGLLFVWDVLVTVTYFTVPFTAPDLPLTLFGTAVALVLGFRSNSAYNRWWEGRGLWGLMINASRNLLRGVINFMPDPEAAEMKRRIAKTQVAYVNALRCQLRRLKPDDEVRARLPEADADAALAKTNVANALLNEIGREIDEARRMGWIDTIQQNRLESVLIDIANSQGGMERLKNTPLPNQYRFFPTFFTHLFCVLLPFGLVETLGYATPLGSTVAGVMFLAVLKIGDDLVDPFANTIHDLPLNSMCRTIEIDALQSVGLEAPKPITPDKEGVLW
ncbi:bestrophin family protein [Novosphingobium sp. 9]|uniref:bestrophin family protein n=1 Tax=Novosphingobium sp. 9 TaxID=2025349 RepID=UPI0021B63025|nr:bestrophin family ion channel [Novosphingobium sp. 9]